MPIDLTATMQHIQVTLASSALFLEECKKEREEQTTRIQMLEHAILGTAPDIHPTLEDKECLEQPADDNPWSSQGDIDNEIMEKAKKNIFERLV